MAKAPSVGFGAVLATQSGVDLTSDLDVLRHSRDGDRIPVCHDKHRDRHTLLALLGEICNNGGKVSRSRGRTKPKPDNLSRIDYGPSPPLVGVL